MNEINERICCLDLRHQDPIFSFWSNARYSDFISYR